MAKTLFIPWSKNVAPDATLSVIYGAVDTDFPLAALVDGDPSEAAKLTTTHGVLLLAFAAPVHLAIVALIHHNLDAGLTLELRGYASLPADETTPADLTVTATVGALEQNRLRPNLWFDVDAEDDAASYRWWAIALVGDENTNNIAIGECFASTEQLELPNGIGLSGSQVGAVFGTVVNTTYAGVSLKATKQTRRQQFTLAVVGDRTEIQVTVAAFNDLYGRSQNALFVPDTSADRVHLIESADDASPLDYAGAGVQAGALHLIELSRGLAWP